MLFKCYDIDIISTIRTKNYFPKEETKIHQSCYNIIRYHDSFIAKTLAILIRSDEFINASTHDYLIQ